MKNQILAVAFATLASPVLAGGPTIVAEDPAPAAMPAPVAAHDWSGTYVGLSYGNLSGTINYSNFATIFDFERGAAPSIYAGYLMQRGNLVYGGELAFSKADNRLVGFPAETLDQMVDLKGKVGYSLGNALVYGVAGLSKVDYINSTSGNEPGTGLNYGLGLDVALGSRFTVGLEYLQRKTEGDTDISGQTREVDLKSVGLRVGLSF